MKIIHFCAGLQFWNGMANTARQFIAEEIAQGHESFLTNELGILSDAKSGDFHVVYIHGAWLPILWKVAKHAKRINAKLIIRPAGSYDPVRLGYHSWKKRLVAFFERRMLRRADVLLGTCEAEVKWIKDYVGEGCPKVEITDLKRFFNLAVSGQSLAVREGGLGVRSQESGVSKQGDNSKLNVLYLGRRHPLKGIDYFESAVKELNHGIHGNVELKIVSDAKGEELEKVWAWCDVLVLPTLSENFGRVVAEALERGKRVITTDGAPVWDPMGSVGVRECGIGGVRMGEREDSSILNFDSNILIGYGGRLLYLRGYRDGAAEDRILLLNEAIKRICK